MLPRRKRDGRQSDASVLLTVDDKAKQLSDSAFDYPPGLVVPFSRQELGRIKKRFATMLPPEATTELDIGVVKSMPELATCHFAQRLLRVVSFEASTSISKGERASLRKERPQTITFAAFLTVLSLLSVKQSVIVKRKVLFDLYDCDVDGIVSVEDFVSTLFSIGSYHGLASKQQLRDAVAAKAPAAGWTAEAFQQLFTDADVQASLSVVY